MKKRSYRYAVTALSMSACFWAVSFNTGSAALAPDIYSAVVSTQVPTSKLQQPQVSLEDRVEQWVQSISKQEGWESWKSAKRDTHTLGPGTHGWIVQLSVDDKPVGYLIVNASETGDYMLGEYGRGEAPLFSQKTLNDALSRQGLMPSGPADKGAAASPLYYDALQALWQIGWNGEMHYLDAQTGEELPFDQLPDDMEPASGADSLSKLNGWPETSLRNPFDPYEVMSWVQGKPLSIKNAADLKQALDSYDRVTFVGNLYKDRYHVPLAVIGFAQWNHSETFVAVSVEPGGERYIPLQTALSLGAFYP